MNGWDWLIIAVLAGVLIVDIAFDWLLHRRSRARAEERDSHNRLMAELRRQP